MLHQLSIGHLVQYAGFVSFLKNAARQDRRDKIDELFADDGLFGLNPTLSELFVVLVAVKYQLKEPSVFIAVPDRFRRQILIGLENDCSKIRCLCFVTIGVVPVLDGSVKECVLLNVRPGRITERVEIVAR